MNDYKAKIEAILIARDRVQPVGITHEEATTNLLQLLDEARIEELETINKSTGGAENPAEGQMYMLDHIGARLAELKGEKS